MRLTEYGVRQAGIGLGLALPGHLPGVVGTAGQLEQVLINLINNARDLGRRRPGPAGRADDRGVGLDDRRRRYPADRGRRQRSRHPVPRPAASLQFVHHHQGHTARVPGWGFASAGGSWPRCTAPYGPPTAPKAALASRSPCPWRSSTGRVAGAPARALRRCYPRNPQNRNLGSAVGLGIRLPEGLQPRSWSHFTGPP